MRPDFFCSGPPVHAAGSLGLAFYVKETTIHLLEKWELRGCKAPDKDWLCNHRHRSECFPSFIWRGGGVKQRLEESTVGEVT